MIQTLKSQAMTQSPSPWRVLEHHSGNVLDGFIIVDDRGVGVCHIWLDHNPDQKHIQQRRAIALLIAAAPELLRALEAVNLCEFDKTWGGYNRRSAETLGLKEQYQAIGNPGFKELIRSLCQDAVQKAL